MATAEERLMEWLRDAHAMEEQAITMLTSLAERIENYPEVKAQVEAHLEETRRHEADIRACIERRGGGTSLLKDLTGKVVATGQGLSGMFVSDEIVKGAMASYTFEHMEIASYTVLVSTAEAVGDMETREVCHRILQEELAMAERLQTALPFITRKYLNREETPGRTAKH
jgi:ferritin-like metal-binding protein YciE